MPIADPSLPIRFLDVLETTGLGFVVLHREAEIGKDSLGSDLDLAVEVRADDVVRRTAGALRRSACFRSSGGRTTSVAPSHSGYPLKVWRLPL